MEISFLHQMQNVSSQNKNLYYQKSLVWKMVEDVKLLTDNLNLAYDINAQKQACMLKFLFSGRLIQWVKNIFNKYLVINAT